MAKPRRQTKKQDDFVTARDLFGPRDSMWPRTREELIDRQRQLPGMDAHILAIAVCGTPPTGEEPHGITDEWIWTVEEITPHCPAPLSEPGPKGTYRRISVSRIVNPKPGCWLASWKGGEGTSNVPLICPPELFKLVPFGNVAWRAAVEVNPDRPVPTVLVLGKTNINTQGGAA